MKADFNRRCTTACDAGHFKTPWASASAGAGAAGCARELNSLVVRRLVDVQGNIVVLNPVNENRGGEKV